jgi:hypothetical protein
LSSLRARAGRGLVVVETREGEVSGLRGVHLPTARGWRLRGRRPAKSRQKRAGLRQCGGSLGRGRHGKEGVAKTFVVARSCRRDSRAKWPLFGSGDRVVQKKVMASFSRLFVRGAAPSGQRSRWMDVGDGRVEEDQVSIGGPLAAELRFGCVLPGPWGYDCWAGVGSTGA